MSAGAGLGLAASDAVVGVAQVDGERGAAGHDVHQVGLERRARPTVRDLVRRPMSRASRRTNDIDRGGDVARRRAAVASASCRRGSTGRTIVSSVHEMPCTPSTTPIVTPSRLEDRALLDVQLDEGMRRDAPGHGSGPA